MQSAISIEHSDFPSPPGTTRILVLNIVQHFVAMFVTSASYLRSMLVQAGSWSHTKEAKHRPWLPMLHMYDSKHFFFHFSVGAENFQFTYYFMQIGGSDRPSNHHCKSSTQMASSCHSLCEAKPACHTATPVGGLSQLKLFYHRQRTCKKHNKL